jgi:hypothetical protein
MFGHSFAEAHIARFNDVKWTTDPMMPTMKRLRLPKILLTAAAWLSLLGLEAAVFAAGESRRIKIEYVEPKDPKHQSVYDLLMKRRALEQLQALFSPLRLPSDLTLRIADCKGVANAWYHRGTVTICYELLDEIRQSAPKEETPAGILQEDALVGQFLYVAGHEIGHAVFDLLDVPIFASDEDAADQFSTYLMLRLGKDQARRLILGAAYHYKNLLQNPSVTMRLQAFADVHSRPPQRFFNLICTAYGANPEIFAEVVVKGYLPKERAKSCQGEYFRINHAFQRLILPHVDPDIASEVFNEAWLKWAPR